MRPARVLALPLITAIGVAGSAAAATAAPGGGGTPENSSAAPLTLAVLGDTPYGDDQREIFPALVEDVNSDPRVRLVLHAGDVKSGSQTCDNARFADVAALYDTFADPFVLTPGDNDWTDCHRANNGSYLPTERLEHIREVFYPQAGVTLGRRTLRVDTQADEPAYAAFVENTRFIRSQVVFASVHVVGSSNGLALWSGLPGGDNEALRLAEFEGRQAAALDWIDAAFDRAVATDAAGVLLHMQAEPLADDPGFTAVRERILTRSAAFDGPVLLVHGDEHQYEVEPSYAGVDNLTRLETFGDTATEWLRLTVDPRSTAVFSWSPQTVAP